MIENLLNIIWVVDLLIDGDSMDVQNLAILIYSHNMRKKSFEKVKLGMTSFIKWIKNGNTYFEYDEHPYESECEIKKFMKEQINYMNWMLAKELEARKVDDDC